MARRLKPIHRPTLLHHPDTDHGLKMDHHKPLSRPSMIGDSRGAAIKRELRTPKLRHT